MEDEKKDEHDVKAQKRVLDETMLMLPNTKTRLEGAIADLDEYIVLLWEFLSFLERHTDRVPDNSNSWI